MPFKTASNILLKHPQPKRPVASGLVAASAEDPFAEPIERVGINMTKAINSVKNSVKNSSKRPWEEVQTKGDGSVERKEKLQKV